MTALVPGRVVVAVRAVQRAAETLWVGLAHIGIFVVKLLAVMFVFIWCAGRSPGFVTIS